MNLWIGTGRLTADPVIRATTGENPLSVASFSIAVDRREKNNAKGVDFFAIECFGKTAEVVDRWAKKGRQVCVTGRIKKDLYEKDGVKKERWKIIADRVELLGSKADAEALESHYEEQIPTGFGSLSDDIPF